ncbi:MULTISPECIES: hypothetical protein [unclassified Bradyrhizobium]|uniref:hypothetical protein n=1 Tax=unclassified Bradyrhizobium TaxID=2631580 RepID=UPI001FFB421F|nr:MULTISPECIES: hypothetical protein [unclassified Bradyrhizobium]MCK1425097.1 hypothetical protein [Bradyrhizobium sp. CW12]MCK1643457.1 hypothetical protein [Bradyrhizobium sp. 154]
MSHVAPDLCEQFAEPAAKPLILKLASRSFPINPRLNTGRQSLSTRASARSFTKPIEHPTPPNQVLNNESQQILPIQDFACGAAFKSDVKCG